MRYSIIFILFAIAISLFGQACDDAVTPPADGDVIDGDEPDGDEPDGDEPDGDVTDGDVSDGDVTDGDEPDGDEPDGDVTDGDEPDGDEPDGDMDGDAEEIDGDMDDDAEEVDGDMDDDAEEIDGDLSDGDMDDDGELELEVGCADNDDCGNLEYCSLESCDATSGSCETRPTSCPDIYDPVCGCNGTTYGNPCEAAGAGTNVDYYGSCFVSCTSGDDCSDTQYCDQLSCDATGTCETRPSSCTDTYDPACGCDGTTYTNACQAARAGITIDYNGVCIVTCSDNGVCGELEYCAQTGCDTMGTCETRPSTCPDIYDPVCACDGLTYQNTCQAARAGYSVDYPGACVITCYSNLECAESDYCSLDSCAAETGNCTPRPSSCMEIYDPVCGCNGTTYDNACKAARAGVNVNYAGVCSVQ